MANYILLMKLTPEGQHSILENPDSIAAAASEVHVQDVTGLGLYAVLGPYDFVSIIQAPDNDAAARYSVRLGRPRRREYHHPPRRPDLPPPRARGPGHRLSLLRKGSATEPSPPARSAPWLTPGTRPARIRHDQRLNEEACT